MKKMMMVLLAVLVLPLLAGWEFGHDYDTGDYPIDLLNLSGGHISYGIVWETTTITTDGTIVAQAFLKNNQWEAFEVTFFTYTFDDCPDISGDLPLPPDEYYDSATVALPLVGGTYTWLPYDGVKLDVPPGDTYVAVGVRIHFIPGSQKVNLRGIHPDPTDRSAYWESFTWRVIGNTSHDSDWCIRWTDGDGSPVTEVSWGTIKSRF